MRRRWVLWLTVTIAAAGVVVLAVVFASRFGEDPRLAPSPLIDKPAPAVTAQLIEGGGDLSLADYRGQVLVVNFWAPWCVPCREEHGILLDTAAAYEEAGVTVIGLAYDSKEPDVIDFLEELGRGYPVAMDVGSRASIAFGIRGVPETFFIDADGVVAAKVSGPVDETIVRNTVDALLALAADPGTSQP